MCAGNVVLYMDSLLNPHIGLISPLSMTRDSSSGSMPVYYFQISLPMNESAHKSLEWTCLLEMGGRAGFFSVNATAQDRLEPTFRPTALQIDPKEGLSHGRLIHARCELAAFGQLQGQSHKWKTVAPHFNTDPHPLSQCSGTQTSGTRRWPAIQASLFLWHH